MSAARFNPQVVRVERPARHYCYLTAPDGNWLATRDGSALHTQGYVDDQAIWRVSGSGFRHAVSDVELTASSTAIETSCQLTRAGTAVGADGALGVAATFTVGHGPEKLPSEYLRSLREDGYVSMACILSPSMVDALRRVGRVEEYAETSPDPRAQLAQDAAIARATIEPVTLWLLREMLQTRDVRLGHPPSVNALPPDDGKRDVQGWHTDFPYLWGTGDRVPTAGGGPLLGMQRNTCVSDFRVDNGATLFRLGSHRSPQFPPDDWGITNQTMRRGYRAEHGLPYGGPEASVIEAPAGSMVLYDARTWHRAGTNLTNRRRGAMIQAFVPTYVMPFMDTSATYKAFLDSAVPAQLTARERLEVEKLLVHRIAGPAGLYAIATDERLTKQVRERAQAVAQVY